MAKKKLTLADLRGKKLTVINRGGKLEGKLAPLTPAALDKIREDVNAKMMALEQEWAKSGHTDLHTLLGALVFCELQLPRWLFKALFEILVAQLPKEPGLHWWRWLLVKEGIAKGLTWDKSYDYAAERATGIYAGKSRVMKESYQICQKKLRDQQSGQQ